MGSDTHRPGRRWVKRLLILLAAAFVSLWLGGFVAFAEYLKGLTPANPPSSDGIVVLTGDRQRLVAGLELLSRQPDARLLITGVNPATRLADLSAGLGIDFSQLDERIDLGRDAADTVGNAEEAAIWALSHDYRSLTIVTAGYHMPRSLMVFRRRMPGIRLIPYPVFPDSIRLHDWWRWPGTTRLLFIEYHKYLASRLLGPLNPAKSLDHP